MSLITGRGRITRLSPSCVSSSFGAPIFVPALVLTPIPIYERLHVQRHSNSIVRNVLVLVYTIFTGYFAKNIYMQTKFDINIQDGGKNLREKYSRNIQRGASLFSKGFNI